MATADGRRHTGVGHCFVKKLFHNILSKFTKGTGQEDVLKKSCHDITL